MRKKGQKTLKKQAPAASRRPGPAPGVRKTAGDCHFSVTGETGKEECMKGKEIRKEGRKEGREREKKKKERKDKRANEKIGRGGRSRRKNLTKNAYPSPDRSLVSYGLNNVRGGGFLSTPPPTTPPPPPTPQQKRSWGFGGRKKGGGVGFGQPPLTTAYTPQTPLRQEASHFAIASG